MKGRGRVSFIFCQLFQGLRLFPALHPLVYQYLIINIFRFLILTENQAQLSQNLGQLEIKNNPEEFRSNDQEETVEIETIEVKDENSYEMEVQEDFELQLESDSDDDMNDNEIEPPTMENKDDGKHFFRLLNSRLRSLIILCVCCSGLRSC